MRTLNLVDYDSPVKFVCVICGEENSVEMNIAMQLEAMEHDNIDLPPRLVCRLCNNPMIPEDYTGINGTRYMFHEYKDMVI